MDWGFGAKITHTSLNKQVTSFLNFDAIKLHHLFLLSIYRKDYTKRLSNLDVKITARSALPPY